jgi:hypothetical protein
MRSRFDDLSADCRPRSEGAEFSKAWRSGGDQGTSCAADLVEEGVQRWRLRTRSRAAL